MIDTTEGSTATHLSQERGETMGEQVQAYYLLESDYSQRVCMITAPLSYRAVSNLFVSTGRKIAERGGEVPSFKCHFLVGEEEFKKLCLDYLGIFPLIEKCVFPSVQQAVGYLKKLAQRRGMSLDQITEIEHRAGATGKSNHECYCLRAQLYMSELRIPAGAVSWREGN